MIDWKHFKQYLIESLSQPLPGYAAQKKMMSVNRPDASEAPSSARQSGVLLLCYPKDKDVNIVLIERSNDGGAHSGQIAFPGGKKEETDADIIETALREANEEINLDTSLVKVLGRLSSLYIPISNFVVNPVLAIAESEPILEPSDYEVASILKIPISKLFIKKEKVQVQVSGGNLKIQTIAYLQDDGRFIWGATAMILSEVETMLQEYFR